eukprot:COSAG01_NODE_33393_length_565_cov_0.379828_1_plen_143_part_10
MEPEPAARVAATNAVHGAVLALGSDDTTASLVNARTGERTHHLRGLHTSAISSVALSADGAVLALGSEDRTASIVDARTGERRRHLRGLHTSAIRGVAFPSSDLAESKTCGKSLGLTTSFDSAIKDPEGAKVAAQQGNNHLMA